mgnify:CR=1 FL=1
MASSSASIQLFFSSSLDPVTTTVPDTDMICMQHRITSQQLLDSLSFPAEHDFFLVPQKNARVPQANGGAPDMYDSH